AMGGPELAGGNSRPARPWERPVRGLQIGEGVEDELRRWREREAISIALAGDGNRAVYTIADRQRRRLHRQRQNPESIAGGRILRNAAFDQQRVRAGERQLQIVEVTEPA